MTDRIAGHPDFPAPEWPEHKTDVEARDESRKPKKKSQKMKSKETHDEPSTVFVPTRGPFCKLCDQPCGWAYNKYQVIIIVRGVGKFCSTNCSDSYLLLKENTTDLDRAVMEYRILLAAKHPYYTPRGKVA